MSILIKWIIFRSIPSTGNFSSCFIPCSAFIFNSPNIIPNKLCYYRFCTVFMKIFKRVRFLNNFDHQIGIKLINTVDFINFIDYFENVLIEKRAPFSCYDKKIIRLEYENRESVSWKTPPVFGAQSYVLYSWNHVDNSSGNKKLQVSLSSNFQ